MVVYYHIKNEAFMFASKKFKMTQRRPLPKASVSEPMEKKVARKPVVAKEEVKTEKPVKKTTKKKVVVEPVIEPVENKEEKNEE